MNFIQGNSHTGIMVLRVLGFLGAGITVFAHFLMWHTILNKPENVVVTGLQDAGFLGLIVVAVFLGLLLLNSVYAVLPAILLLPYMLEQVIGTHLLRYMPFESTKLGVGLYLYLPFGIFLILLGSLAPILYHCLHSKK